MFSGSIWQAHGERRDSQGQREEGASPIGLTVTLSWSWSEGPRHSFLLQV